MNEFTGARYFLNIPAVVAHDKRLNDKSIILFGEVYAMLNTTGEFFMSNSTLAKLLNTSPATIKRSIRELEQTGYIERAMTTDPETGQIVKRYIKLGQNDLTPRVTSDPEVVAQMTLPPGHERPEGRVMGEHIIENINRESKRTINIDPQTPLKGGLSLADATKEIISYLNQQAGTSYRASSKATQRFVHARLKENYTVDDCKKVIDIKVASWKDNPKMSKYLRPQTLFSNKFEGYLNEPMPAKQPPKRAKGYLF